MIENLFVRFGWGSIFIDVSFITLLPFERQTYIFAIGAFFPLLASGHNLPDEMRVVAASDVVAVGFRHDLKRLIRKTTLIDSARALHSLSIGKDVALNR